MKKSQENNKNFFFDGSQHYIPNLGMKWGKSLYDK